MGFFQYLRDTKGELRYVAWPTRMQTIVYTVLVIALSIFVALYLGLFDYIFTSGLKNTLEVLPQKSPVTQPAPGLTITNLPLSSSTPVSPTTTP